LKALQTAVSFERTNTQKSFFSEYLFSIILLFMELTKNVHPLQLISDNLPAIKLKYSDMDAKRRIVGIV